MTEADERRARLDLMIESYDKAKQRQLFRRSIRLWRRAEANRHRVLQKVRLPRVRVH